jgi:hypothetical protein
VTQPPFTSVSVVLVARERCPSLSLLEAFAERLELLFVDVEFIIVANEAPSAVSLELKTLSDRLADSLIVFLGDRVHDDVARLIGIDHAVSDYVLFATPTEAEAASLVDFAGPLRAGSDLVIGRRPGGTSRGPLNRMLFAGFRGVVRLTTGRQFEDQPPTFRVLSRAAALYVSTRREGEVLVRSRNLGAGFPSVEVQLPKDPGLSDAKRSLRRDFSRAARLITTGSSGLLRASSYLALLGGVASAFYAVYVILIFILVPNVEPGWTTLSLQLAGMLLLFSVQFLLLAENVIHISAGSGISNRRHHIIRELRSPLSRRSARLNIVNDEGRYEIGAPVESRVSVDGIR